MTQDAAEQAERNETLTREAEILEATSQAIEVAMTTIEAATKEAEDEAALRAAEDAEATEAAIIAANEQATADARAAADAQATADALATVNAQATQQAQALATANYEATRAAFVSDQRDKMTEAQDTNAVVDIDESALEHDDDEDPESQTTDVDLRNFVVQTQFMVESGDSETGLCDFGIGFRSDEAGATYLVLDEEGGWALVTRIDGEEEIIQEGQTDSWRDGWNELSLYIDEEGGFFFLNDEYVDELDLEQSSEKGDVTLVTAMDSEAELEGTTVLIRETKVWSMDPIPPTPTPAPTSSSPPTPAPVAASTFPETVVRENFNRDEFVGYVGQLRDSLRSYTSEMNLMHTTYKPGDCGTFYGWLDLWRHRSPGYNNVPPSFASLYREYRSMLSQVVNLSDEIRLVCDFGGGFISDETIDAIDAFLLWAYPRSEQMVSEASALPAP
jgi:hypothetical protein